MLRRFLAAAASLALAQADCGRPGYGASGKWLATIEKACDDSCCCASECAANDQCVAWQWITSDKGADFRACYLKSSPGLSKHVNSVGGEKPSCGVEGTGASGQFLALVDGCATTCCCQKACRDHTNCAAWQFITDHKAHDFQKCFLKSSRNMDPNGGSTSGTIYRGTKGENCQWADNVELHDDGRPYAQLRYGVDQETEEESVACVGRMRTRPNWQTAFRTVLPKLSEKHTPGSRRRSSAMLKRVKAWAGADGHGGDCRPMGVVRMELEFFSDDEVYDIGSTKDAVTDGRVPGIKLTQCEFKPGQMFAKAILGYNDINGFSYISIMDTTGKHACELGAYPSGSKCFKEHVHTVDFSGGDFGVFLAGVTASIGKASTGANYYVISQFGFVFWKQPQKVEILDVWFPTFDSLTKVRNPSLVAHRDYCNDLNIDAPTAIRTTTNQVTNGQSHCFKRSASSSFDYSFGEKVSITTEEGCEFEKEKETNTRSWRKVKKTSHSESQKACSDTTTSMKSQLTFPAVTIPAHKAFRYSFSQWQGEIHDLPYECTVHLAFEDGKEYYVRNATGVYSAATFLSLQEQYTNEKENVTHCEGTVVV